MPVLLLLLLAGVLAYLFWRRRTTSLTRHCRWRQELAQAQWRCSACGAVEPGTAPPRICRKPQ
ncbi:hypothetical protein [Cribrihabitans pelagius]|uniref:hypothetical protein n=1 Tax=Cribrihabitans pelagius TaxID=1765746 RepID=UPI003B59AD5C